MDHSPAGRMSSLSLRFADVALSRRGLVLGGSTGLVATVLPRHLLAQQSTPEASPATPVHDMADQLVIPEVELIGTADGIEFPATVKAGLNKVTMINITEAELHVFIVRLPDGLSEDELRTAMTSEELPDWWTSTLFTGNPDQAASGGGTLSGYITFQPGKYVIVNPLSEEGQTARFEATGDAWGQPAPIANVEIGLLDMAFKGFDAPLPAGPNVWRITNHGTTWHDVTLFKVPNGTTTDDVMSLFAAMDDNSPFPPDGWELAGGIGATSPGATGWIEPDLKPGTHVAACFLPTISGDDADGLPHALHGMVTAFEVE